MDASSKVNIHGKLLRWGLRVVYIPGNFLGGTGALSRYGVSENKAAACLQMILNNMCGQDLQLPCPKVTEMEDSAPSAGKWNVGDLTYTLPTPQTIHTWI